MQKHFSYWRGIAGLVALMIFMGFVFLIAGPGDSNAASDENTTSSERQQEFKRTMEQRLGQIGAEIDQLKEKAKTVGQSAQGQMNEQISKLETQRQHLQGEVSQAGAASGRAWERFRSGIEGAWVELKKGVQSASNELKASK